jgi:hypothetical protein
LARRAREPARTPPYGGEPAPRRTGCDRRNPIEHFGGLETYKRLPRDGKCVTDYWF